MRWDRDVKPLTEEEKRVYRAAQRVSPEERQRRSRRMLAMLRET